MNNNTRRYPRTLTEAFGPYTSYEIHPMKDPAEKKNWFLYKAIGLSSLACLIVAVVK